jgi:hypothetical protein
VIQFSAALTIACGPHAHPARQEPIAAMITKATQR